MAFNLSRRQCLRVAAGSAAAAGLAPSLSTRADEVRSSSATATASATSTSTSGSVSASASASVTQRPPKVALNTSTLRGQKLSVPEQITVTSAAGFDGIEPWIRELRQYLATGGAVTELKSRIDDAGLEISGAIGFARWIVDDEKERRTGLDEARRDMELVRSLGGRFMAAPPIGAARDQELRGAAVPALSDIADRYHALLEIGEDVGVTPLLELWGFSRVLSTLGELAYVATAAEHPSAGVLPDFYHIYKGGNSLTSLAMIEASRMPLFHINDYPAEPPIETIGDGDRVFPGDGVCPLVDTVAMLLKHGFVGTFSLELFNPEYWQRPADEVAAEGYRKTSAVIQAAMVQANVASVKGNRAAVTRASAAS